MFYEPSTQKEAITSSWTFAIADYDFEDWRVWCVSRLESYYLWPSLALFFSVTWPNTFMAIK